MNAAYRFLKQFELLVRLKRQIWKGPRGNFADLTRAVHQAWRRLLLSTKTVEQVEEIEVALSKKDYPDQAIVTITFGSRLFGNSDNNIGIFLESFLEFTSRPERIEILVKIDNDDDLPFFHAIKTKYSGRIQLRFFPSARGRGYEDMHLWHHELVKHRCSTSRLHYILTDDAVFRLMGWDDQLISLLEKRGDSFFIGTACTLEQAITFWGPNPVEPVPVYWIRGDDYPVYGFDLLGSAAKVASQFPGWTEFGDLQLVDQYAGALLLTANKKFGVNLHQQIDLYAERRGGNFCWSESPARAEIRTRTLTQFFSRESEEKREQIVAQIVRDLEQLKR